MARNWIDPLTALDFVWIWLLVLKQKEIKPFAERYIRNRVGHEGDLDTASKRLGHTNPSTTSKYYRTEVVSTVNPVPTKH